MHDADALHSTALGSPESRMCALPLFFSLSFGCSKACPPNCISLSQDTLPSPFPPIIPIPSLIQHCHATIQSNLNAVRCRAVATPLCRTVSMIAVSCQSHTPNTVRTIYGPNSYVTNRLAGPQWVITADYRSAEIPPRTRLGRVVVSHLVPRAMTMT